MGGKQIVVTITGNDLSDVAQKIAKALQYRVGYVNEVALACHLNNIDYKVMDARTVIIADNPTEAVYERIKELSQLQNQNIELLGITITNERADRTTS